MKQVMYRLTPNRILTLNNRWERHVHPKYTIFFIPWDGVGYFPNKDKEENKHIRSWIHFLKFTKHRKVLYLHTVYVEYTRRKDRILKNWKNTNLNEIMIPERCLGHIQKLKVQVV